MSQTTEDTSKTNTTQESTENTGEKDTPKTFTQEDVDRAAAARAKRAEEKFNKDLEARLKKEREDWERQAKLTAEEKADEDRKRMEQETAEKLRDITLRENRADARELLQEKNISADLVDFVVDVDPDKTKDNIDSLEKAFLKAVEQGVNDRLKGQTPKDKSTQTETPQYSGTTVI